MKREKKKNTFSNYNCSNICQSTNPVEHVWPVSLIMYPLHKAPQFSNAFIHYAYKLDNFHVLRRHNETVMNIGALYIFEFEVAFFISSAIVE